MTARVHEGSAARLWPWLAPFALGAASAVIAPPTAILVVGLVAVFLLAGAGLASGLDSGTGRALRRAWIRSAHPLQWSWVVPIGLLLLLPRLRSLLVYFVPTIMMWGSIGLVWWTWRRWDRRLEAAGIEIGDTRRRAGFGAAAAVVIVTGVAAAFALVLASATGATGPASG